MGLKVFLNPGDWWFGRFQPGEISTILGSCVSIVLTNPKAKILGVSHAILPENTQQTPLNGRFAQDVVLIFVQQLQKLGLNPLDCRIGLFGGGAMFANNPTAKNPAIPALIRVGEHNVQVSLQSLAAHDLQVVRQDTGGCCYRRLHISLTDGSVQHETYPLQNLAVAAMHVKRIKNHGS